MKKVIAFLDKHAGALQALTAILTVLIALGALIGVKMQINASERVQREQSARDIYREYLNLSISRPEFSRPNYCALLDTPQEAAYENYVEYLLYTAEQAIAANPEWEPVFSESLKSHADYVCTVKDWSGYSDDVRDLITKFKAGNCGAVKQCEAEVP
jgi:hypothetical protein